MQISELMTNKNYLLVCAFPHMKKNAKEDLNAMVSGYEVYKVQLMPALSWNVTSLRSCFCTQPRKLNGQFY